MSDTTAHGSTAPRPPNRVLVSWAGEQRFDTGRPGGPVARIDGDGKSGQSPVDAVLSGLAACASIDVVEILAKRRTPVERLDVQVTGERVNGVPRRLERIQLDFHIDGEAVDRMHAERAIDLAIGKYCSVRDSLSRDIAIEWTLTLNGAVGVLINEVQNRRPATR